MEKEAPKREELFHQMFDDFIRKYAAKDVDWNGNDTKKLSLAEMRCNLKRELFEMLQKERMDWRRSYHEFLDKCEREDAILRGVGMDKDGKFIPDRGDEPFDQMVERCIQQARNAGVDFRGEKIGKKSNDYLRSMFYFELNEYAIRSYWAEHDDSEEDEEDEE